MNHHCALVCILLYSHLLISMNELPVKSLPDFIQKKIYFMMYPCRPWKQWLAEQSKKIVSQEVLQTPYGTRVLCDHSKIIIYLSERTFYRNHNHQHIYYSIPQITHEIDCVGSFNHYKASNPFTCKDKDGKIEVTCFNKTKFVIDSGGETIIDTALSTDSTLFAAIGTHRVMVWDINNHMPLCIIQCHDENLEKIVNLNSRSIVLQDKSNTVFSYGFAQKKKRVIYCDNTWHRLYPIAFDSRYTFVHTYASTPTIKITKLIDVIDLFAMLSVAQKKLLRWLYKAHLTGNKLDLTSKLAGAIRAREVFFSLPEPIRLLTQEFVELRTRKPCISLIEMCAIS